MEKYLKSQGLLALSAELPIGLGDVRNAEIRMCKEQLDVRGAEALRNP